MRQAHQHAIGSARRAATFRPFVSSFAAPSARRRSSAGGPGAPLQAHPDAAGQTQTQGLGKLDQAPPLLFSEAVGGGLVAPDLLADVLPHLTPQQLADAIWGFAKQGSRPPRDVMDAIASEVLIKLEQFGSPDLSNTIWALAVLKYQPSAPWWAAFERQVYQHLTDFSDREAANLMWSLAVLDHRPTWVLEPLLTSALDALHHYSPNALHLVGWSCGKLGYCPSREWLEGYLRAAQASFFQFSPAEMSNIIWALAKLVPGLSGGGAPPVSPPQAPGEPYRLPSLWLDNFLMVTQWRFPSFSAKTLSVVAWAVASLGHTPSQEWLVLYEQQVREKFSVFSGQELACIAWALRRFGAAPEHNAVFYMLERQEGFLEVDFEILSNSSLLSQVHQWRHEDALPSASSPSSSATSSSWTSPSSSSSSPSASTTSSGGTASSAPAASASPAPHAGGGSARHDPPPARQEAQQEQQQEQEQGPAHPQQHTREARASPPPPLQQQQATGDQSA